MQKLEKEAFIILFHLLSDKALLTLFTGVLPSVQRTWPQIHKLEEIITL